MKGLFLASLAIVLFTSGYCAPVLEKKSSPQVSDVTKKVTKDSPVVVSKEDVHKVSESSVKKSPEVPAVVTKSDKISTDAGKDKVKPVPVAPQYFAEDVMKNVELPKVPMRPEEPKVAQSPGKKETSKPTELKSPMPMRSSVSEEKKDSEKKLDSLPTSTGDLSKRVESPKKKDEKVKSPIVKDEKRTEESKLDGESKVKSPMVVRDEEKKKMDQAEEMKKIKSPMVSNTDEMKKLESSRDEMKNPLSTRSDADKHESRDKYKSPESKDDKMKVMDDSSKKFETPKDEMKVKSPMAESEKKKMEMKPVEEMKKSPLDEMKKSPMEDMKVKSPMTESEKKKMEMKPVEDLKKSPMEEMKKSPLDEMKKSPMDEMKKSPMAESGDRKVESVEAKKSPMLDAMRNKAPLSKDEEEKKKLDSSKVMMNEEMKKKSPMSDVMKKPMEDAMKMKDDAMKEMKVKDEAMKVKDEAKKFESEKKFDSWKPSDPKIKSPEMDSEMKKKVDESMIISHSNKKAESPMTDSKKKLETPVMMKDLEKKVAENTRPLADMENGKKSEDKRIKSPIVKEEEKRIENSKESAGKHQSPVKTDEKKVVPSDIVESEKKIKETIKPYANVDPISKSPENWKTDKTSSNIGVSEYAIDIKSEENGKDVLTYLSEPINQATKLLMDLDEHIKGYLNSSPDVPTTVSPPHSYGAQDPPSAPAPASVAANPPTRQDGEQLAPMINQIENTLQSLDQTINDMMANRRYMSAAMMRSMRTYLRGVQTNLVRLQNRVRQLQAVTTTGQGQGDQSGSPGGASSLGLPNNIFFDSLRDRINRITNDITSLMFRMSQTLGGSSTTPKPQTSL
ncbi:uncharacterized protein LOC141854837 [Brevipalpus obovatus]|uniref:uncharacterized protein LOC141854837 n=1 Tax=Brevipalpus obovatus TaxID=246614 RepID=UPI003D9EA322